MKALSKPHKRAIELKYRSNAYTEIADILNQEFKQSPRGKKYSEDGIKQLFKEGGTLYEAYRQYEMEWDAINKELALAARKAGIQILEKNFRMTCEMLIALLGSEKDNVKLGAIREILDRVVGKAKQPVEIGGKVDLDMSKIEHRLDEARKYGDNEGSKN